MTSKKFTKEVPITGRKFTQVERDDAIDDVMIASMALLSLPWYRSKRRAKARLNNACKVLGMMEVPRVLAKANKLFMEKMEISLSKLLHKSFDPIHNDKTDNSTNR